MELRNCVAQLRRDAEEIRRGLHRIPETAFEEFKTRDFILEHLKETEPDEIIRLSDTGLKAVWYAKEPESTLAFRADMDALNLTELNETDYVSEHEGKMHGCGHDGHMTMLLLLAKLVHRHRDRMRHNVALIFQPGEEGKGGARVMINAGTLKNLSVDRIFGFHLWPAVPKGKIGVRWGEQMARSCEFDVGILGRSAHGASPQNGIDAIVAAAEFIAMLQSAITRSVDPHQDALLTIGRVSGGVARNVIADRVDMNATLRVFSSEVYDQLIRRIHSMADGVALATGARFVMQYPSVNNPRWLVEDFYNYVDMDDIVLVDPSMAAEDFSCYQERVPGLFMFLGVGGGKNSYPLHNGRFDFDEDVLLTGVEIYCRLLGLGD